MEEARPRDPATPGKRGDRGGESGHPFERSVWRPGTDSMAKIDIEQERCKGCRLCVSVCPKNVIVIGSSFNQKGYSFPVMKNEAECTGCALCAEMCPDICIRVWR